jgi:hypothetical protein
MALYGKGAASAAGFGMQALPSPMSWRRARGVRSRFQAVSSLLSSRTIRFTATATNDRVPAILAPERLTVSGQC